MWWREDYPKRTPRKATGGIKAQTQRGQFGKSWWAKRWIAVLESFNLGARLARGRSYARNGQVLNVDINTGKVTAKVQGSFPKPYNVTIEVKPLTAADWKAVVEKLSAQAVFTARLLSGEMPQEIESVFAEAKLSLFPAKAADLKTECSCPDYSNPCKHIAAVYYLLGEEFDRDPFLIFRLRGMNRDDLLAKLGTVPSASKATGSKSEEVVEEAEPLPLEAAAFWGGAALPTELFGEVKPPVVTAALLQRLGNFPFWRGLQPLSDALAPVYAQSAQRGMKTFLGEETAPS